MAVFGAGYVLGSRAGRERYGQILAAARRTATRLQEYSRKLEVYSGETDDLAGRQNFRAGRSTTENELSFAVELAPRLTEGLTVDATILARLPGMPLLQLDAPVTFVPADFRAGTGGYSRGKLDHTNTSAHDGDLRDAGDLLAHAARTLMTIECASINNSTLVRAIRAWASYNKVELGFTATSCIPANPANHSRRPCRWLAVA